MILPVVTDWLVCRGEQRDVVDGMVSCPAAAGEGTSIGECLDCHHLEAFSKDRRPEYSCSTWRSTER
jgi:hypothetical protein